MEFFHPPRSLSQLWLAHKQIVLITLAADVSRINFPALFTIPGVEKLGHFLPRPLPLLLFLGARQARIDGVSRSISLGKFWEGGSSLWNSSFQRFLQPTWRVGPSFLLCSLVSFALHHVVHRFTDVGRRGSAKGHGNAGNLYFPEVGLTRFEGWGCNLRCKRFEGLISGGERWSEEVLGNFSEFLCKKRKDRES